MGRQGDGGGPWTGEERRAPSDQYVRHVAELGGLVKGYTQALEEHRKLVVERLDGLDEKVGAIKTYPSDHDDFMKILLAREKRRVERSEKIKAQVGGWAVLAVLGGVGTAVWHWVVAVLPAAHK